MISLIYDLLFFIIGFFYLPYYIFRKKSLKDISRRLKKQQFLILDSPIWVHAVSVGETLAVRPLIKGLKEIYPKKKIILTTVTSTAKGMAERILPKEYVYYLPLDLSFLVKPLVKKIRPSLVILTETEIWPNLIIFLKIKGVPIVLVNGRLSLFSFRGYRIARLFFSPILNRIDMFLVQSLQDKERFLKLGVNREKIKVTGNMKFDILEEGIRPPSDTQMRRLLGINPEEKVWVAGSTHPGEEERVFSAYQRLKSNFPLLRLVIAPRHPERSGEVNQLAKRFGFSAMFVSDLEEGNKPKDSVFILDIMGRLLDFYYLADIVFVGGSLIKKGGHNPIEPALFKKPIIFGPYMFNFQDISQHFLKEEAALVVNNSEGLYKAVEFLLNNPQRARTLGENAYRLIERNQGTTKTNLRWINSIFSGT